MQRKREYHTGLLNRALLLAMGIGMFFTASGQDLHFSQFFNSPLTENPANTGFLPDANYRFGGNYRNQWSAIGVPYNTYSVYGDGQFLRDRWYFGWLGLGGVILQDDAGGGSLKSTKVYASVAYHQLLGQNSLLSLGFNGGYAMKRLDLSKLTFPDQFNNGFGQWFFDGQIPTGALIDKTSTGYLDLQAGLNYALFPTDKMYFNLGFSAQHLNRPKESFVKDGENEIGRRYIGFFNAIFKLSSLVMVNPNAYYTYQRGASETVFGGYLAYNLSGANSGGESQLLGGLYYRLNESVIPVVGYQLKGWNVLFSYDVTASSMSKVNQRRGAYEISLTFKGVYKDQGLKKTQILCPTF